MRRFARDHWEGCLYVAAGVTYVLAGIWQKGLLNWIVGPLWLVAWVEFAPRVGRFLRRATARGDAT